MSAPGVVSNYGLAFSISPARPSKSKDSEEDDYSLTLAPFTKAPKISFGTVKLNTLVERNLLIINPQQFEVKLNVVSQELAIDNMELLIDKMSNINFKIKWQPDKPDNYKYTIFFEVTNNARLKFLVHCYGVCTAPVAKKPVRKPFTMLQPIKKDKSANFADPVKPKSVTATLKPVSLKENNPSKKAALTFETSAVNKKNLPPPSKTPTLESRTTSLTTSKSCQFQQSNQTFLIESIYNKPPKVNQPSIYNQSFEEDEAESTTLPQVLDIRRQTCIIGSPKINKDGKFMAPTIFEDDHQTGSTKIQIRRSLSATNLASPSNYSFIDHSLFVGAGCGNRFGSYDIIDSTHHDIQLTTMSTLKKPSPTIQTTTVKTAKMSLQHTAFTPQNFNIVAKIASDDTPKLDDFLNKKSIDTNATNDYGVSKLATQLNYDLKTPGPKEPNMKYLAKTPHDLYTTCYDDAEESFQTNVVASSEEILHSVLVVQRQWRMKMFRRSLPGLRLKFIQEQIDRALRDEQIKHDYALKLMKSAAVVVKAYRYKRFRKALGNLRDAERLRLQLQMAERQRRIVEVTIKIQKAWRMRSFRRAMAVNRAIEYEQKLAYYAIVIQRAIRMKNFRGSLIALLAEQYEQRLVQAVILVQRKQRMKQFRRCLSFLVEEKNERQHVALQNQSATIIQKHWKMWKFRMAMKRFHLASIRIQRWLRFDMKDRFVYLRQKRAAVLITKVYKKRFSGRLRAAVIIQKNWRMWREMKVYSYYMHQIIRIQRWIRSKVDRFRYIKIKRTVVAIQALSRSYIQCRGKAALTIQRCYRMHLFRVRMSRYRHAATTIQRWHRSMAIRYDFLHKKTIIYQIQLLYRRIYLPRRQSAALHIQSFWRMCMARKALKKRRDEWEISEQERFKELHLHTAAIKIQAYWRGYIIRKETNQILNSIRGRLSIYVQSSSNNIEHTLGARIRKSLEILTYQSVTIPQIITALIDLEKVTRLSPECCLWFTREQAPDILYTFISNCNRSVPHMDLIKFCLRILINLAKYEKTVCAVLEPCQSLVVLTSLIQSYQLSNPVIFMDVCVLFIILCVQAKPLRDHLVAQESFITKLQCLHKTIYRRTHLKFKNMTSINSCASTPVNTSCLNSTVVITPATSVTGTSVAKKGNASVAFTMEPDWSLSKKALIEFPDQLTALEYLLNTLGVKYEKESQSAPGVTPVKSRFNHLTRETLSSSKSSTAISRSASKNLRQTPLLKSQSIQVLNNQKPGVKKRLDQAETNQHLDDHQIDEIDMCAADMTVQSVVGEFNEEPKMNSTILTTSHRPKVTGIAASTIASASKQAQSKRKLI